MLFRPRRRLTVLYATLDLSATFVFALSGGTAGVKRRLDLFGVMVVAFAAGNAGASPAMC